MEFFTDLSDGASEQIAGGSSTEGVQGLANAIQKTPVTKGTGTLELGNGRIQRPLDETLTELKDKLGA
jgi:hypothetical protein